MKRFFAAASFLVLASCLTSDNPYDPTNPGYVVPFLMIDTLTSTIADHDTTAADSVTIAVIGNDHGNQFRWRLDSTGWGDWDDPVDTVYVIVLSDLDTGWHAVDIQTCYSPDGDITDTTLSFYRASTPRLLNASEPRHELTAGANCTLWVHAVGTPPLRYAWYKDSTPLGATENDTMVLSVVSLEDSGSYSCTVASPWGETVSDTFIVRITARFAVTYDANGATDGTVPVDSATYSERAEVTVRGNNGHLVNTGHTFAGWCASEDGNGETFLPGATFSMGNSDVKLYARWLIDTCTIVFDSRGGTTVPTRRVIYGGYVEAPPEPTRANHTFGGWFTDTAWSDSWNFGEDSATRDDTLYAKWTIYRYTVTFDSRGGSSVSEQVVNHGALATEPPTPWLPGHFFDGWRKDTLGVTPWDFASDSVTQDVRLHATWSTQMTLIPARDSSFEMGSADGGHNELPVHTVTFTYDFWMDTTEVTQKQYRDIMEAAYPEFIPPGWSSEPGVGDDYPAYQVSWYDAALYCNARTKSCGSMDTVYVYAPNSFTTGYTWLVDCETDLTANGYRLPTEAEWEYACRAGTTAEYYWGAENADEYAWHYVNSDSSVHQVAQKLPNAFGLYDMSGNLYERCNDFYGGYSATPQTDPAGPDSGSTRVIRGGSWRASDLTYLRSANRGNADPDSQGWELGGFRVVLPVR